MNLNFEKTKLKNGICYVIGCDEVGRGSLAGPVVACAVALDLNCKSKGLEEVKDSKRLLPAKRRELSVLIKEKVFAWAVAEAQPATIDKINIHHATLLAMRRAVEKILQAVPSETCLVCVDGKFLIQKVATKQQAIVGGDNKIFSIAAASILAKVHRDQLMQKLDQTYPEYGFAKHKGYGTLHHRRAIKKFGMSPVHRQTFCSHLV
ncbi:MAG: ribonuclease HII [Patescibacteria group bacterium]|nr:ribonuclease HII [Patescibacteria group bacterium]